MKKTYLKILLLTAWCLSMLAIAGTASAAAIYGKTCDIAVYPFDPSAAPILSTYIGNPITPDSECKNHLPYPTTSSVGVPYTPSSPDPSINLVKAGDENKQVPWVVHAHAYYNDSGPSGPDYYYKAAVDKFEITIQPVLGVAPWNKLDLGTYDPVQKKLSNIACVYPAPGGYVPNNDLNDCSGSDPNLYGGTRVKTEEIGNTVVITWEFGLNNNTQKMIVWGNNGNLTVTDSNNNPITITSDPYDPNRHAEFDVNFSTKNNPENIWAATTTTRVLIADLAIKKTNWNSNKTKGCAANGDINDSSSGWCYLDPNNYNSYPKVTVTKAPSTAHTYFWYPIGSVASIWKKPVAPPPPQLACQSIDLTPQTINGPNADTNFSATVHLVNTANPNVNVFRQTTVQWTNLSPPVNNSSFTAQDNGPHSNQNPFTATYRTGTNAINASMSVAVTQVQPNPGEIFDQNSLAKCSAAIKTPFQGPPICSNLNLNYPGSTVAANSSTLLFGNPVKTDNSGIQNESWTENGDGYLEFDPSSAIDATACPLKIDNETVLTRKECRYNYKTGTSGSGSVTVSADPNDNVPACTRTITWGSAPQPNVCTSLGLTVNGNPTPDQTVNIGPNSQVLLKTNPVNTPPNAAPNPNPNPIYVQWTQNGAGSLAWGPLSLALNQANGFFCPDPTAANNFVAPITCDYYYTTPANGSGSVTITAQPNASNPDVSACTATLNFSNNPPPPACINLNYTSYGSNGYCVQPNPGNYSDSYRWYLNNGTTQTNGTCFTPPSSLYITRVEAVNAPNQCYQNFNQPPPPPNTQCIGINPTYTGNQLCLNPTYSNNGTPNANDFHWSVGNPTGLCNTVPQGSQLTVNGPNALCSLQAAPPQFIKTVQAISPVSQSEMGTRTGLNNPLLLAPSNNNGGKTGTIDGKEVLYTLSFRATSANTDATITDPMNAGFIQGYINGSTTQTGGIIKYNDQLLINGVGECNPKNNNPTNCYTLSNNSTTTLPVIYLHKVGTQQITVTYHGIVQGSSISDSSCRGNVCQEEYDNTGNVTYTVFSSSDLNAPVLIPASNLSSSAAVKSFCQYILTRAAGDIYLQTDLNFGKDISQCSEYKSSTGVVITPAPTQQQSTPSTGASQTVSIGHDICTQGLGNLFGQNAASPNLSSQICEVKLRPGQSWEPSTIASTIQENTTRVSRWTPNLNAWSHNISFDNLPQTNTGVYHLKNANLTIGDSGSVKLNDGQGAKTFIVENGDLIIKNNITYGACVKTSCTVRDTASLAFIVLNGNVIIDPGVTEVSGVIFVQQGAKANSGKILTERDKNGQPVDSYNSITFYGSIYGDIQDLFTHRKFAGDPAANQGSVVIRFDERIILNTPPGLTDILQLNETQVAQ